MWLLVYLDEGDMHVITNSFFVKALKWIIKATWRKKKLRFLFPVFS